MIRNTGNVKTNPAWRQLILAGSVIGSLVLSPLAQAEQGQVPANAAPAGAWATSGAVPPPPGPYGAPPQFRPDQELETAGAGYAPPSTAFGDSRGPLTRDEFLAQQEERRKQMDAERQQHEQAMQVQRENWQQTRQKEPCDKESKEQNAAAQQDAEQRKAEQDKRWNEMQAERDKQWESMKAQSVPGATTAPPAPVQQPPVQQVQPARYPPPAYGYGYPPPPPGYVAPGWGYRGYPAPAAGGAAAGQGQ